MVSWDRKWFEAGRKRSKGGDRRRRSRINKDSTRMKHINVKRWYDEIVSENRSKDRIKKGGIKHDNT